MNNDSLALLGCARVAEAAGLPMEALRFFWSIDYVPLPHQIAFHVAALLADEAPHPNKLGLGGDRGGAKSHAAFIQLIYDCHRHPKLSGLYLRKVGAAAKKQLSDLREKTFIKLDHEFSEARGYIKFPNGSMIIIGNFKDEKDADKYVGIEYDVMLREEPNQLSQDKMERLDGSLRTSKQTWRPRSYDCFNPGGVGHRHLVDKFVVPHQRVREAETRFFQFTWRLNPFLNADYKAYLNGLTGILRRMWRDGDWTVGGGQYFVNWDEAEHVVEPFPIPAWWVVWGSVDHGFQHPATFYLHTRDPESGVRYTVGEVRRVLTHIPTFAEAIRKLCVEVVGKTPGQLAFIKAGHDVFANRGTNQGITAAAEYKAAGVPLSHATIARVAGAERCSILLGDEAAGLPARVKIFNSCSYLIDCLPRLVSDPKRPEDVLKVDANDMGEGGDDEYDGWRYGMMVEVEGEQTAGGSLRSYSLR